MALGAAALAVANCGQLRSKIERLSKDHVSRVHMTRHAACLLCLLISFHPNLDKRGVESGKGGKR